MHCTKYDSSGSFENIFALLCAWKSAKEHELLGKSVQNLPTSGSAGVKTSDSES